jgi:tetratricopeptide (TPR) repeat protein
MKNLILISMFSCFLCLSLFAGDDITMQIMKGDSLFKLFDNKGSLEEYLAALQLDSMNYEANWKASRAYTDVGENIEEDDERAEYYLKGSQCAKRAVKIDSTGSKGHLYLSIALGRVALDAGAKERIKLSKDIKKEVDLAIKYDPNDDIAYHVLGRWNRKLSNLSWIESGFANMFLGGVPEDASEENAIAAFKKSIKLKPNHINHHLELGITYEMMDMEEEARKEFQTCLDLPNSNSDDAKYKKDAQERLEDLD